MDPPHPTLPLNPTNPKESKKNPEKVSQIWDPILEALIPELFEHSQSVQLFKSYARPNIFAVFATTLNCARNCRKLRKTSDMCLGSWHLKKQPKWDAGGHLISTVKSTI
jgi:hypothetical protein